MLSTFRTSLPRYLAIWFVNDVDVNVAVLMSPMPNEICSTAKLSVHSKGVQHCTVYTEFTVNLCTHQFYITFHQWSTLINRCSYLRLQNNWLSTHCYCYKGGRQMFFSTDSHRHDWSIELCCQVLARILGQLSKILYIKITRKTLIHSAFLDHKNPHVFTLYCSVIKYI